MLENYGGLRCYSLRIMVAIILALLLSSCTQPSTSGVTTEQNQSRVSSNDSGPASGDGDEDNGPIRLAVLVSLTTDSAIVGTSQRNGALMAIQEVNEAGGVLGRQIEAIIEDTADSNTTAVNAFNRAMSKNPHAIIGTVWGTQMLALEPLIRQAEIPIVTPTGTRRVTQLGNPWIFRFFPHDGIAKVAQMKFAIENLGSTRPAILYTADEYGQSGRDIMLEYLNSVGIEPVAVESTQVTDKDVSTQLVKIRDAGADALVVQLQPTNLATAVKQVHQLGINIPFVASNAITLPSTLELVTAEEVKGVTVETAIVPEISSDQKVQEFNIKYNQEYGKNADSFATLTYDSTKMLLKAMEDAGTTNPFAVAEAMRAMRYEGLVTTYEVDKEGNAIHQVIIYRFIDNKELEEVTRVVVDIDK